MSGSWRFLRPLRRAAKCRIRIMNSQNGQICERVQAAAKEYWSTPPNIRSSMFAWLEAHVMECDPCALKLEDVAEEKFKNQRVDGESC